MLQRRADHYETLLGILKVLTHTPETPFWRERADDAIAKPEAILAGAPDAEIAGGEP
jgi:predicted NUDIX family NTP pyrophosphohydrolase